MLSQSDLMTLDLPPEAAIHTDVSDDLSHIDSEIKDSNDTGSKRNKKRVSSKKSSDNGGTYRYVPKCVARVIRSVFGVDERVSQNDCLVAYLYCFGDERMRTELKPDLTEKQKALIRSYHGDSTVDLDKKLRIIMQRLDHQSRQLDTSLVIGLCHIMDRLSMEDVFDVTNFDYFSGVNVKDPNALIEMLKTAERDAIRMRDKREYVNGLDISKNVGNKSIPVE